MENNDAYLLCLKKGLECGDKGITYNEMTTYLKEQGINVDGHFHKYFYVWFFDNFYHHATYQTRISGKVGHYEETNPQYNDVSVMTYDARQKYIDYLYLQESNKKSDEAFDLSKKSATLTKSSNKLSKYALVISIVLGLISLLIGGIQIYYAMKQDSFNQRQENTKVEKCCINNGKQK